MRRIFRVLVPAFLVALLAAGVSAQTGGSLAYGSAQVGTISTASPLVIYSFPASAGDLIAVDVIALTPGFDPSVSLLSPSQEPIAASDSNSLTPGAVDARIARRLNTNGTYALLVGGANGTIGDFLIKLNGLQAGEPPALPPGSAAVADFTASPLPQFIAIPVDPSAPGTLTLAASPATFAFSAQLYGPDGSLIALLDGVPQASVNLPAAAGAAVIALQPASLDSTGMVQISTGGALPDNVTAPAATQEPGAAAVAPANVCTASSGGTVNLRSGPGTNYGIVGSLNPGMFLPVQGISPDRGWYAVNTNGAQAWSSATVVTLNGPCGNLSTIQPPAAPPTAAPGQATATPFASATAIGLVTVTPLPDSEPPTQAITPTPPPVAPPDNDYQVELDRNNGGSFSQQISYPAGDRSDRISVSVSNFDSANSFAQFAVTLACTGTGTEYVRWGENQAQNLACGQSLTLTLNNESNQRFLNVTLPDGSGPALVNYTLVFIKVG
ncbi:MAG: SH3 domain-containing protein [Anaerolineae bacterium]|nr:SH3 domain-containing protein [Anaerolineae bacterium]